MCEKRYLYIIGYQLIDMLIDIDIDVVKFYFFFFLIYNAPHFTPQSVMQGVRAILSHLLISSFALYFPGNLI